MRKNAFKRIGGKHYMIKKLLPLIPEHDIYCEVFGGSASLLLNKTPVHLEVYNDIDSGLANLFRVITNPENFKKFYTRSSITIYSRELFLEYYETWKEQECDIEKAFRFFYIMRSCFAGNMNARGWATAHTRNFAKQYFSAVDKLPEMHERFKNVVIDNRSWEKILEAYDTPETFFYMDPPYALNTRLFQEVYEHEMTNKDHIKLIEKIKTLKGKVMLSGYENEIYRNLEWNHKKYKVSATSKNTKLSNPKPIKEEIVWMNYDLKNEQPTLFS